MRQVNLCFQIEMHAMKSTSYLIFHGGNLKLKIGSARQREQPSSSQMTLELGRQGKEYRIFIVEPHLKV